MEIETDWKVNSDDDGKITSGHRLSYWLGSIQPLLYKPLQKDIFTEVVVIGAGISGLTTAYCLAKSGRRVVVVEDGFIGSGETGRTTAHLVCALDDRYYHLENLFGEEKTRLIAQSHSSAIDFIEQTVHAEDIECEFRRLDGYLFLHPTDERQNLEKEYEAAQKAGLQVDWVDGPVPGMTEQSGPSIRFKYQGQFHPMKYLEGLARAIIKYGGEIYTESRATKINKEAIEANGHSVMARYVVVATNSPVNDWVTMHTKQHPYRTYVVAALVPKDEIKSALWWDTGNHDTRWTTEPYNYLRLTEYNYMFDLLICGGQDHKTGQGEDEDKTQEERYDKLEAWMRARFPMAQEVVYRWSGQVIEPVDSLGFMGRNPGDENIFVITGDSGNGMTHGTIGAMLITDLINGKHNEWEQVYDPARISLKATPEFIKETLNMASQYADYVKKGDLPDADKLPRSEGAILSHGLKKIAAYRDEEGTLHAFSAVCPHLACIVQWNEGEKTFDCPCHGSRFTCKGEVVNGPSTADLKRIEIKEE